MTWWDYVTDRGGDNQSVIARRLGIPTATVSRWQGSTPKPESVAAFARAYGRPALEAFVAAGFLTADEAGEQPTAPPSLATLSDDDLIEEVRRRMTGGPQWSG